MSSIVKSVGVGTQQALSAKTLGELKRLVAAPVGAKDNPDEVRALDAIHMALDWLVEWEWDWYLLDGLTFATEAGTATYALTPQNGGLRTLQNLRVSGGTQRPLTYIREPLYNRLVHDQSAQGLPLFYSLNRWGQQHAVKLFPTPSSVETVEYDAFTEPTKETDEAKVLLIPNWLERPLVLQAQALVSEWRGRNPERLFALAVDARLGAAARDRTQPDESVRFLAFEEHGVPRTNLDVEPSLYDRLEG